MKKILGRLLVAGLLAGDLVLCSATPVVAEGKDEECATRRCPTTSLGDSAVNLTLSEEQATSIADVNPGEVGDYAFRLRSQCVVAVEATGNCSPATLRTCPQQPGRVIDYFFIERRPVVRPDGTAVIQVLQGQMPGDLIGSWATLREGCIDITPLNPPPSPAEVFSYFERLPLPILTTQHQPPGNGLTGLPVIFYTDSPTTQTFTVNSWVHVSDVRR